MSDYLRNARDVSIGDNGNFSTVQRDQHNHYNQIIQTSQGSQRKRATAVTEDEEARYAEYHDVRLGDIVIRRDLGASKVRQQGFFDKEKCEWIPGEVRCERKLHSAEVRSKAGKASSSYTVVSYHGPEKEEVQAWKKDFDQFTGALSSTNVQVFGYNHSKAPLLLLYNNLVPLAHFLDNVGGPGKIYLELLRRVQLHLANCDDLGYCNDNELWMDPSRGFLCRGPPGPDCSFPGVHLDLPNIPSNAELLQEDVLIRYMATLKLSRDFDRAFVTRLINAFEYHRTTNTRVDRPAVISSLTNTTIAVADAEMTSILASRGSCLGEREVLSNGLTRFTFKHHGHHLELDWDWYEAWDAWMAQSLMVFHNHGIPLEGNLSKYNLILLSTFEGTLSQSRTKQQRRQKSAPIYLFACPSRASTFWSSEEDGHLPILDGLCKYLGLPVKLSTEYRQYTYSTQSYKAMRDYQILRGFDPTTASFARHCGFYDYVFHPIQPSLAVATTSSQFEDQVFSVGVKSRSEGVKSVYMSLPALFGSVPVEDAMSADTPEPAEFSMTGVWSRLITSFSWAASEDSDIPAAGF